MDLQDELERRKTWFFETQLRRLNYDAFRSITPDTPGPHLDLISEDAVDPGPVGHRPAKLGRLYLDSRGPVWSADERARHDTFAAGLVGRMGDWFDLANPVRLARALAELKTEYEQSKFSSEVDLPPKVKAFGRTQPGFGSGAEPYGSDEGIGPAISRAELAAAKPWLIPEIYNARNKDTSDVANWVANLESFIADYETELELAVGGIPGVDLPFDLDWPAAYRDMIGFMQQVESARLASDSVKVKLFELAKKKSDDKEASYGYRPSLRTAGSSMVAVPAFPLSERVKYWTGVVHDSLKEVVVLKANSDMGLCQVVRMLYRYGVLPDALGTDADLGWRIRAPLDDRFAAFFAKKAEDPAASGNADLLRRLRAGQTKLQSILEGSRLHPRSSAPMFSPLAGEIVKQGLLSYKFWMDEALRANGHAELNKIKAGVGTGDADTEMEFWSENHYIMFASCEYLLGQLWKDETFQPGRLFLKPDDKTGILTGEQRRKRGRARVLKWLNNRLLFGWTEFHSSGYYREHLWALLNLVDFALDDEVKTKAQMVVDLLLFDVVRYLHKGAMGAPGGRSQFKSKGSGWDNGLGDVVEMLLGTRGIFNEGSAQIGASFATSTYKVPDALLEIGASPPSTGFVDRSRVSITFDEAPKYGITWSLRSAAKDSLASGYAAKRERHFPFLERVNAEIERTHNGYGRVEDDTVFFWGMSAFFNKQVVRNTFATADKFGLEKSPAFIPVLRLLIETLLPLIRRAEHGVIGGALGLLGGGFAGEIVGAAVGVFASDILADDLEADAADDLSLFIEGSIRTRANILSYRNPDVMLASIQVFRTGQLNFQSNVNQATLNTSVNVFTTSGFAGFFISDLWAGLAGGLVFGPLGALGGIIANEALVMDETLGPDDDGPSWWTGYWALPMVVQSGSAAILIYDFHASQSFLAETGSHAWFPKSGFSRSIERRTSAYDDADFFLLDVTDIGPKGFWLFGKVVHPATEGSGEEPREGYVGVFSNQRPAWLDKDFDLYERRLETAGEDAIEDQEDALEDRLDDLEDDDSVGFIGRQVIEQVVKRSVAQHYQVNIDRDAWVAAVVADLDRATAPILAKHRDAIHEVVGLVVDLTTLRRVWESPFRDPFADRDWYAEGKNVWIMQVGNKDEFGSFEGFMDRVSSARIHLDDTGDMECSYDIPKPGGGSDRLSVAHGDGGRFGLNGAPFETDLYPRFETPFVRGGRVEWGQREYCIEWNGKTLLHDMSDFDQPVRQETPAAGEHERDTIKGLVIFLKTGDEAMEVGTVATASVQVGCASLATDQVVAAGPVGEDTRHDAEWIFLDRALRRNPDMTLTLRHPGSEDDDEPEWAATFSLKALMGDRTLRDCRLSFDSLHFEDERRAAVSLPFVVALSAWADWEQIPDGRAATEWTVATHPPHDVVHHEYNDLVALDRSQRLWHRRLTCGAMAGAWERVDQAGAAPDWATRPATAAVSDSVRRVVVFVAAGDHLAVRWRRPDATWADPWARLEPYVLTPVVPGPFGPLPPVRALVALGPGSTITPVPTRDLIGGAIDLVVTGADGHLYTYPEWHPGDDGEWHQIEVVGFALAARVPVQVAGGSVFALGSDGNVWTRPIASVSVLFGAAWRVVTPPGVTVRQFAVASAGAAVHLAVTGAAGDTWVSEVRVDGFPQWRAIGGSVVGPGHPLRWVTPLPDRWSLIACGRDGIVRSVECTDGDESAMTWREVGGTTGRMTVGGNRGLAAISRARGQIEVFAEATTGTLMRTWWS